MILKKDVNLLMKETQLNNKCSEENKEEDEKGYAD
jgi:hypothetical protein